MDVSLTPDQMLATFEAYNIAVWPMQLLAYLLAILALYFTLKSSRNSSRITTAILSFLWLWTGIVFCIFFWGPAYRPAYGFAVLAIIQGVLFSASVSRPRLSFLFEPNVCSVAGMAFIAYAMIGYPLVGSFIGHNYPRVLPLGLVPCPTTIFTFGLLMMTDRKVPRYFLVVPLLLALSAPVPVSLGILEDIGLILAGLVGTITILFRDWKRPDYAEQPSLRQTAKKTEPTK